MSQPDSRLLRRQSEYERGNGRVVSLWCDECADPQIGCASTACALTTKDHSISARFVARVREVAQEYGYAIAVHGSEYRDLDLVAAPWTVEAVSAQDLVDALVWRVPLEIRDAPNVTVNSPEPKPWGRLAWSLYGCLAPWGYVDLSVMPRAGEAVPIVHRDQAVKTA